MYYESRIFHYMKLRFMDKVTDQNYKNMYFPAEIATITSVKQFDIDLPNIGIFFFSFMCHYGYFKNF